MAKKETSKARSKPAASNADATPRSRPRLGPILVAITLAAVVALLLALLQWMQLLVVLAGGGSFCSLDETMNCDVVWSSPFAQKMHRYTGVPIAGWGLVWGFSALAVSFALWLAALARRDLSPAVRSARITGVVGIATSAILLAASWKLGTFCPTCLLVYLSVIAFAGLSFRVVRVPQAPFKQWVAALRLPAIVAAVSYAALLLPGKRTPFEPTTHITAGASGTHPSGLP